MAVEDIV